MRVALDKYIYGAQFFTFCLAVLGSTFVGGGCTGLFAVLLSTLSAWYFLVPPYTFTFLVQGEPITLLSFVAVGVVCVVLIASLQAAAITIADHRAHLATLEERLKAAEELHKWQEIFQNIAVGVCVTDPGNDTIGLANPAYAAIHEVPREDVLGKSLFEFYDPREWQRVRGLIANSDCTGHSSYETDCRNKSGSVFHARVHNTSVRGSDGELRYRITTTQDITKERELEERLRQAQRLEAVGQLTAGVAHDFRNVLHGVVGCLHLVQGDPHVSEEMMQAIVDALQFTEAGTKLTDQLLSFARKQELAPQRIELRRFLSEFCTIVSRTLGSRIKAVCNVEPGLGCIWADPSHLQLALLNLAINARDAMPSGGQLRFEASVGYPEDAGGGIEGAPEGFAAICVMDNGEGIAPEHLSKVLEPFFTTKGSNGTGMGLSMAYGFAKQSGGTLRITSEPGKGTSVELFLPLAIARPVTQAA
jgi:PAS domain S-box-containing protein